MKIILAALVGTYLANVCQAGHGWDFLQKPGLGNSHFDLGEITLESHGFKLPTITLGHGLTEWPGSAISSNGWSGIGGKIELDSEVAIPSEWQGKINTVVKEIGVPVPQEVQIKIPHLVPQQVAQPYPVLVPVPKPEPFEVVKTVVKTVEKKVPTPVEKIVPVKVEKPVPFKVYKNVPYPVVKHIPIKIPVHKTIHHYSHGHH